MGYSNTFYTEHVRHQEAVAREKRIIQEHPPRIPDSDRDALMASMGYYGRPGCLSLDTVIRSPNGVISLGKVLGKTQPVLSYNWLKREVVASSARIVDSGRKSIFLLTTETGKQLRASAEHIFFVLRDGIVQEIMLDALRVGDRIAVVEN